MDSKINYPGFDRDIKEAFASLMEEYSLVFREIWEGCYELENKHCILKLTFDKGDINCNIRQPKSDDRIGEGVYPVLRFLSPENVALRMSKDHDFRDTLKEYAAILSTNLRLVLQGDFSWLKDFLIEKEAFGKLTGFVWTHLDKNSPIYLKFKNGDISWIPELKEYIRQNKIVLSPPNP